MFRYGLMDGERILVTGGGTGLGKEMAEGFLKLGATVYICGRRQGKLDETAAELQEKHGGKIVGMACDIRDADAIKAMVDAISLMLVMIAVIRSIAPTASSVAARMPLI